MLIYKFTETAAPSSFLTCLDLHYEKLF